MFRWIAVVLAALAAAPAARAAEPVGTAFPADFPVIQDASLGKPVIGFGAPGPVRRTPVIFLHGNNDTPYPTDCNASFGKIHAFAQYFADHGYAPGELWGLGYQGEQCDVLTQPANKSGAAHSTVANVPDLRAFVAAVLEYTGAKQVDIVGHSLGTTLAREWMRQDGARARVRTLVAVDGPNHGIINCSPSPQNYFSPAPAGGFNPDSAICREYGAADTPFLQALNADTEIPGPTRYLVIRNADTSFVFFAAQDGAFPASPAEDREGRPHDFSGSARLAGAPTVDLLGQGRYDQALATAHLGIVNSPETWRAALDALAPQDPPAAAPAPASPAPGRAAPALRVRVTPRRDLRAPFRFRTTGRVTPATACHGTVLVRVKAGRNVVSARLVPLRAGCRFRSTVAFASRRRLGRGRLRFLVHFTGNDVLAPATARPVRVRARP